MYQYLLQSGRRESTVATYMTGLNNFIHFLQIHLLLVESTLVPECLAIPDVTPTIFGHYLAWMFQAMYSFNTIRTYTTAVKMWCRAHCRPNPTLDIGTTQIDIACADVWQAIKRLSKPSQSRFAVTFQQLQDVCISCQSANAITPAIGRNVAAAACLAWYGLLRGSEYTAPPAPKFDPTLHACRGDVRIVLDTNGYPHYMQFTVKNCKTDNIDRRGFVSTIYRSGTDPACAVMRMHALFEADPQPPSTPLFRFNEPELGVVGAQPRPRDSSHRTLTTIFSRLLLINGYKDENVSSHSFRRGGATALFRSGASEYMVMQAGRWRSSCWQFYVEHDHTYFHSFAQQMSASTPIAGVRWDAETVPTFA
jgi:hypothetical protein